MKQTFAIASTWDGLPVPASEMVQLELRQAGDQLELEVAAPYHGDPAPEAAPGVTAGLWEHEVVELFLLGKDQRYLEIELGPHGHYLLLQLHGRRRIVNRELTLDYRATIAGDRWHGLARLPVSLLPPGPLRANAYAIHGTGAARRHLAWEPVPGEAPDFHRLERFRLVGD